MAYLIDIIKIIGVLVGLAIVCIILWSMGEWLYRTTAEWYKVIKDRYFPELTREEKRKLKAQRELLKRERTGRSTFWKAWYWYKGTILGRRLTIVNILIVAAYIGTVIMTIMMILVTIMCMGKGDNKD